MTNLKTSKIFDETKVKKTNGLYHISPRQLSGDENYNNLIRITRNPEYQEKIAATKSGVAEDNSIFNGEYPDIQRDILENLILQQLAECVFNEETLPELLNKYNSYAANTLTKLPCSKTKLQWNSTYLAHIL